MKKKSIQYLILISFIIMNCLMANDNMELIGHFSCDSCYTIDVKENYLFVGSGKSIVVVDISDPTAPFELSRCFLSGTASGITIKDTLLYVMDSEGTLQIISIADNEHPINIRSTL